MIKNYFKTAWRNLIAGKSFSVINIAGLSIGMAGAILIMLWLYNEISFDKFHANKDNLYEVYGLTAGNDGHPTTIPAVAEPLGPYLKQHFPEVEKAARVSERTDLLLATSEKSFTAIRGAVVDAAFLDMFSFPLIDGMNTGQLSNGYSISITEKLATKLFGNENAIGKTIKIDNADNFTVTGILKNLPANTRFDFEYLLPWAYYEKLSTATSDAKEKWLSNNTPTFIQLTANTNTASFNEKIKNISRQQAGRNDIWTHFLFPLKQWHLYSEFENGKPVGGHIATVRVFAIIAAFILLIACINFMNLSTARSEKRSKEVGIRKVAGAGKSLLIWQFITESFLTVCIAGVIALLFVQLVLPSFNTLINTQLAVPYSNHFFWITAISFILFTSLLAGSYPAFYLSSFKPISIFKKQFKHNQSAITPRRMLVVLQFTFAVILIISTIIIRNQVVYAQDRDKGYSNNNLVQVNFSGNIEKNYALIKQELINAGIATAVTKTMSGITEGGSRTWGLRWPNENPADTNTAISIYSADADLVKTTGMQLIDGRDIDINKYAADSFAVLLNETAATLMGFKNPVGQVITNPFSNKRWTVVGVVKDYVQSSPYEKIAPTVIMGPASRFGTMHIKFNPANITSDNLAKAANVFKTFNPGYPFDYKFVDEQYAQQFDNEQRTKAMAGLFAALTIFISCLGLFGLSAYVAESRVKEIGVRKVLGASVFNIAKLLSIDFVKLVLIAIFIAIPIAWFAMNKWLGEYAYRINISWVVFFVAGISAIAIALVTVSFQSLKAAISNPVKNLRTE